MHDVRTEKMNTYFLETTKAGRTENMLIHFTSGAVANVDVMSLGDASSMAVQGHDNRQSATGLGFGSRSGKIGEFFHVLLENMVGHVGERHRGLDTTIVALEPSVSTMLPFRGATYR
jgi:hypothetical protein